MAYYFSLGHRLESLFTYQLWLKLSLGRGGPNEEQPEDEALVDPEELGP